MLTALAAVAEFAEHHDHDPLATDHACSWCQLAISQEDLPPDSPLEAIGAPADTGCVAQVEVARPPAIPSPRSHRPRAPPVA